MASSTHNTSVKKSRRRWRKGYTTGSCAAAAAKGAVLMLVINAAVSSVSIETPIQVILNLPLTDHQLGSGWARCSVVKDAGDDPDITDGAKVFAKASWAEEAGIHLSAGQGIGLVTKAGLEIPVGEPAINPVPRQMIYQAVSEGLPKGKGVNIEISVPDGERLAKKTLNPHLGIVGGISILGTSGIVEPMSEEAFKTSLVPQIKVALAQGEDSLVLTPGRRGEHNAINLGVPSAAIVQTSNFIGYMLESCVDLGVKKVILFGYAGKLVKVAAGIFHTHSKIADARMETIIAEAALAGADREVLFQLADCVTTDAALTVLEDNNLLFILHRLAQKASERAERRIHGELSVGTILLSLKGQIVGWDNTALQIGGEKNWFTRLE